MHKSFLNKSTFILLLLALVVPAAQADRESRQKGRDKMWDDKVSSKKEKLRETPVAIRKASRKDKRRLQSIEELGAQSPEDLENQARAYIQDKKYELAISRLEALLKWYPDYNGEDSLMWLAGIQYEAGLPVAALESIMDFGEKYQDSPNITRMVALANEIGKQFTTGVQEDYQVLSRYDKAKDAFEFVNTHDPYSIEAAIGLLSRATVSMIRKDWDEAIVDLKEVENKQPGTAMQAQAEMLIGKSYLGLNKGGGYSEEHLDMAIRYLSGYLERYPHGASRDKVADMLAEAERRRGERLLAVVEYYCTARKWSAAKLYGEKILKDDKLREAHENARRLLVFVDKKLQ